MRVSDRRWILRQFSFLVFRSGNLRYSYVILASIFIEAAMVFLFIKRLNVPELSVADVNIVDAFQFRRGGRPCLFRRARRTTLFVFWNIKEFCCDPEIHETRIRNSFGVYGDSPSLPPSLSFSPLPLSLSLVSFRRQYFKSKAASAKLKLYLHDCSFLPRPMHYVCSWTRPPYMPPQ